MAMLRRCECGLQLISTLCTTRCVTAVLNKLSVTESLSLRLQDIPTHLASSSEKRLVGVLEGAWITPLYHDVLGCTGCSLLSRLMHELRKPVSFRITEQT